MSAPLTDDQLDEVIERGWTLLHGAFPASVARAVRYDLGRRIGVDLEDPDQWTQPRVWLRELLTCRPLPTR